MKETPRNNFDRGWNCLQQKRSDHAESTALCQGPRSASCPAGARVNLCPPPPPTPCTALGGCGNLELRLLKLFWLEPLFIQGISRQPQVHRYINWHTNQTLVVTNCKKKYFLTFLWCTCNFTIYWKWKEIHVQHNGCACLSVFRNNLFLFYVH